MVRRTVFRMRRQRRRRFLGCGAATGCGAAGAAGLRDEL
jgi:H+/Cl- antiporter ClcA